LLTASAPHKPALLALNQPQPRPLLFQLDRLSIVGLRVVRQIAGFTTTTTSSREAGASGKSTVTS
jgi:hypothetical protein